MYLLCLRHFESFAFAFAFLELVVFLCFELAVLLYLGAIPLQCLELVTLLFFELVTLLFFELVTFLLFELVLLLYLLLSFGRVMSCGTPYPTLLVLLLWDLESLRTRGFVTLLS
jgi:hypothetical protein